MIDSTFLAERIPIR